MLACVGLAAFVRMLFIVSTVGANNPSNDYIGIVGIVDQVLSGTYDWRNFLSDSFLRTHAEFFPYLIHIFVARFFEWNMRVELLIGFACHAARAALLYDLLKDPVEKRFRPLLAAGIFALVFSVTNASVFVYGETTLPIGLSLLGFTIGLWSIFKIRSRWSYLGLLGGGVLSSYSWGNAPTVWIVLLLCVILSSRKDKLAGMVAAGAGIAVSALPYLVNIVFNHSPTPHAAVHIGKLFQPIYLANALGRTFANNGGEQFYNIKTALFSGACGIFIALLVAVCLWKMFRAERSKLVPAAAVGVFGLTSIYLVSLVRPLIAAWYVSLATMFWIGLLAAVILLLQADEGLRFKVRFVRGAGALVLVLYTVLYLASNQTLNDKAHFLQTRAYASESVLRNFRTAATFSDELVFRWPMGQCGLLGAVGRVLDRHMLGPCARHQMWYLQGDYPLGNVFVNQEPGSRQPRWVRGGSRKDAASWRDWELADLLIPPGNTVVWQCVVPRDSSRCVFTTEIVCGGRKFSEVRDLTAEKGKMVPIVLPPGSVSGSSSWLSKEDVICKTPRIEVTMSASAKADPDQNERPYNVDGASYKDRPVRWQLNLGDVASPQWLADGGLFTARNFAALASSADLIFECEIAAAASVKGRIVIAQMQVNDGAWRDLPLPLLSDESRHKYSYPVRLLELNDDDRLTGLRFKLPEDLTERSQVSISAARLMRLH